MFAAVLSLGVTGCSPKEEAGTPTATSTPAAPLETASPTTATATGTEAEAKTLLEDFVKPGADYAALTNRLRPTKADLEAIFTPDLAAKADAVYGPAWEGGQLVISPKDGQTEVKVFSATSDEIKSGAPAAAEFPGGWKDIADKLKPGLRLYRFKFVKPGEDLGMAFDGLVYVNGNWRIVPKPWKAL